MKAEGINISEEIKKFWFNAITLEQREIYYLLFLVMLGILDDN